MLENIHALLQNHVAATGETETETNKIVCVCVCAHVYTCVHTYTYMQVRGKMFVLISHVKHEKDSQPWCRNHSDTQLSKENRAQEASGPAPSVCT